MSIISHFKKTISFVRFPRNFLVMNKAPVETKNSTDASNITSKNLKSNPMPPLEPSLEFEVLPSPVKSASDKKEYKVIRLKNGLTACLVSDIHSINDDEEEEDNSESEEESEDENDESEADSDDDEDSDDDASAPEQKMAATGLCVGVGSFSDPKNVPGMAHFLEHMVFMGSEKFPEENDFDSFISKRGGSDNASTDCEVTTFYFECLEKDLSTALDKFAQFFIAPLMNRGSINREREAIDSEFQMALPSDSYRKEQLLASFANPNSPVNSFTWGNLITLRDNVSEDELYQGVHEFRKRHYSAHRMTLAIQARLPMDELQAKVVECFNKVPSNYLPPDDFSKFTNVFFTPEFAKLYYAQPVNSLIQVDLTWALPSLLSKYKSKPHQYVSWLLGHEGKGSLLSYLKKKVWGLTVTAGNSESGSEHNSMYAIFTISITLTKEGLDHLNEVIEIVFSYINMLKKLGPQERIYNEIKTISDTSFKFATEEPAIELVEELCEAMQLYPSEDYITGADLYFEYDPDTIQMVLNSLIPNKMNVIVLCNNLPPGLTYDKTEKWFGTKYTEQEIPREWLKKWAKAAPHKEFSIPPPNEFLTEDFTILDEDEIHPEYPEKILSTEIVELWYRKDQKFKLPNAYYRFYLINPDILETSKSSAMIEFYMSLIQISLMEEAYPANVANLGYRVKNYDKGITLSFGGYNQKLHVLIELVFKHGVNFKSNLTEEIFEAVKDKLTKYYYNRLLKPNNLAKDIRLEILINKHHSLLNKYNVMSSITFDDIKTFSDDFIKSLYIKVLVQGNVTKDHAIKVVNNVVSTLKCKPIDPNHYPRLRVTQLPKGEHFCILESFNTNDSNSIITNYYQSGPFTMKDSVIIEILMLLIEEPLFDTLRTKEQLGYYVSCSNRDTFGILGFSVTVNAQATKNNTEFVDKRIEEFIKQASESLANMSEETFETTKKDLIKTKRCVDTHLKEEINRNWSEITEDDYMFDRVKQEIAEIEKLTIEDARKWWGAHTLNGNQNNFKKLSVQVVGFKSVSEDGNKQEGEDVNESIGLRSVSEDGKKQKDEDVNEGIGAKLSLKCVDSEDHKSVIKNVAEFKQNLFIYPVVSQYTINNN